MNCHFRWRREGNLLRKILPNMAKSDTCAQRVENHSKRQRTWRRTCSCTLVNLVTFVNHVEKAIIIKMDMKRTWGPMKESNTSVNTVPSSSWTDRNTSIICLYTLASIDSHAINVTKGLMWKRHLNSMLFLILSKLPFQITSFCFYMLQEFVFTDFPTFSTNHLILKVT